MCTFIELRMRCRLHGRVIVSEDQCAVTSEIVDIFITVYVPLMTALRAIDVEGVRVELAGIVHQAARKDLTCLSSTFLGFRRVLAVGGDDLRICRQGVGHGTSNRSKKKVRYESKAIRRGNAIVCGLIH